MAGMCPWGVFDTIRQALTMRSGLYLCVFIGVPVEPEMVGSVISPILQEGKLRLGKLRELAQGHRAKKWQSQEENQS